MRKLNLTIIAGAIIALVGAALVLVYGRDVDDRIADGKRRVAVLVASRDIPAGTATGALKDMVKADSVPSAYLVDRPVSALTQVPLGQTLVGPVAKGGQLSLSNFAAAGSGGSAIAPAKGKLAVAIEVGLAPGVAGYVGVGSTIDIFYTTAAVRGGLPTTKLFVSGVKVLAVTRATPARLVADQQQSETPVADKVLAVLEVDPVLGQKIVNATTTGTLYLGLTTAGDVHRTGAGATPTDLVGAG